MSSISMEPITLERILDKDNLLRAYEKVVSNKGGAGVDNMKTDELRQYIKSHPHEISELVLVAC